MFTPETIQEVRDKIDIAGIIGDYVTLKKAGNNLTGRCPFHNEKSASFVVSPQRQMFKCFGCGIGGDAIKFIQEHEKKSFAETIELLANKYNLVLEYQHRTEAEKQKAEKTKDVRQQMLHCLKTAHSAFTNHLISAPQSASPWQYLIKRKYSRETILNWNIGYAPDQPKFLTSTLIEQNLYQPAFDAGLINTKDGNSYDVYRNRITIPIQDVYGNIIGFGGRSVPTGNAEIDSKYPKYINPKDSPIYNKSRTWFGLFQALTTKAFKKVDGVTPPAYIVEGYTDVIAMHEAGLTNTVGSCGTAVTADMLKILKRYTNHFIFLIEDMAGCKSAEKTIDLCLLEGIDAEVVELFKTKRNRVKDKPVYIKRDPESFIQIINRKSIKNSYYETSAKRFH